MVLYLKWGIIGELLGNYWGENGMRREGARRDETRSKG